MKMVRFLPTFLVALLLSSASFVALAQEPALDLHLQCTQTKQEGGKGERLIYTDQAHIQLRGNQIDNFQWESSLLRSDRGYQCSIRVEREGDTVHLRPTCPALCGSRMNFTELKVDVSNGKCQYEE